MSLSYPASVDSDALNCAIACIEGTCTDDPQTQLRNLAHVHDYAYGQAQQNGPCPGPCQALVAKAQAKGKLKAGGPLTWQTLLLILEQVIQAVLGVLVPPASAPAQAKKP